MSNRELLRPLPKGHENVTAKEHFELRYLRWDYLVRVKNPNNEELKRYEPAIRYIAGRMFNKYQFEFTYHGMQKEDVDNIARTHAMSFIGLYSFAAQPDKVTEFVHSNVEKHGSIPDAEILKRKDSCNLMSFIQNRLEEMAALLRTKYKEAPGFSSVQAFVQVEPGKWPTDEELFYNAEDFGWRKISRREYKEIRSAAIGSGPGVSFVCNEKVYRIVAPDNVITAEPQGNTPDGKMDLDFANLNLDLAHKSAMDIMIDAESRGVKRRSINGTAIEISTEDRILKILDRYQKKDLRGKVRMMSRLSLWLAKNKNMKKQCEEARKLVRRLRKQLEREQCQA